MFSRCLRSHRFMLGGALGGIIGAALGYFGERYTGDRVNDCAKKLINGVKKAAMVVGRYVNAKFLAVRKAVRNRLSITAADPKTD